MYMIKSLLARGGSQMKSLGAGFYYVNTD